MAAQLMKTLVLGRRVITQSSFSHQVRTIVRGPQICSSCLRRQLSSPHFRTISKRKFSSDNSLDELTIKDVRLQKYLNAILERFIRAQTKLMSGKIASEEERQEINTTIRKLKPLVSPLQEYSGKEQEMEDLKQMAHEMGQDDPELQDAASKEIVQIEGDMKILEREILLRIVPPDKADNSDIILEVSAGVGGQEAFLFSSEMFDMYELFAAYKGWSFSVIDEDQADSAHGGLRKASAAISGTDVYSCLKYEAGVHRVQRVPKTEKYGRVHTSTVTVVVMPQASEIDVQLNPKDLKIDTFRSSGPGGQHVNTTDSAVRIKHIPTGLVAECQAGRSQIKNKATAMKILLSRIYQQQLDAQTESQRKTRKQQAGSAARSEKIRTYNFKQDRLTDHRLTGNFHNLEGFFSAGAPLEDVIDRLRWSSWRERLLDIVSEPDQDVKSRRDSK